MSLGSDNSDVRILRRRQTCIIIEGLDKFDCIGGDIIKALRKLLDSNRNCMSEDMYDPNVLKHVAIGHYSSERLKRFSKK